MVRKVRNGFTIKIGYGAKNENLIVLGKDKSGNDVYVTQFFEEKRNEAIILLEGAISRISQGEIDSELEIKLGSYQLRAEKGKLARRKKKMAGKISPLSKVA